MTPDTTSNEFNNTADTLAAAPGAERERKGKGRRGGNSAHSIVVHSGNKKDAAGTGRRGSSSRGRGRDEGGSGRHGDKKGPGRQGKRTGSAASGRGSHEGYRRRQDTDRDTHARPGMRQHAGEKRPAAPESVLGRAYKVRVIRTSDIGAFVDAPEEILRSGLGRKVSDTGRVLLPFAEQISRPAEGAEISVYFYEDKGGRLACTMRTPILREGELGILKVAASTDIGVFLENNSPKQVLLPFSEQIRKPEPGEDVLVWLYTDKSGRLAATMRVYAHLDKNSPYKEDDHVSGFVYEVNEKMGIFVAVDLKYYGMIPISESFVKLDYGDRVEARVARVRDDGKLDLLTRGRLHETVEEDAGVILYELKRNHGFLPYGDRADASFIEETYAMSKNQFKRALGHLYRNHIVELDRENDTVRLTSAGTSEAAPGDI